MFNSHMKQAIYTFPLIRAVKLYFEIFKEVTYHLWITFRSSRITELLLQNEDVWIYLVEN